MKEEFKNINDLYERLLPAFDTVINELEYDNIYVKALDLWNYLKDYVWINKTGLTLCGMVNDILNIDKNKIIKYMEGRR